MEGEEPPAANPPLPRLVLPLLEPPSPEEIARRRALFDRVMALREEIGPIGVRTDELVRQARDEDDTIDE